MVVAVCFVVAVLANNLCAREGRVLPLATAPLGAGVTPDPILVLAWGAGWCPACVQAKPELARMHRSGKYFIVLLNFDSYYNYAQLFNVTRIPTFFVVSRDKNILFRTNSLRKLKAYTPKTLSKPDATTKTN